MADYTNALRIQQHLQRTLTADELGRVPAVAAAVTRWIDRRTGGRFGLTSIVAEQYTLDGPFVILRHRPVSSVTTVQLRVPYVGSPATTLVAGQGYELLDATTGQLSLLGVHDAVIADVLTGTNQAMGWLGWLLLVSYESAESLPADLLLAADMLAARWLVSPEDWGLSRVSVDGVTIERRVDAGIPPEVLSLLPRRMVFA